MDKLSIMNTKLVVKPIAFSLFHKNAYQGPCRYGEGYALTYEYDEEVGRKAVQTFKENLEKNLDFDKVDMLEPAGLHWCEDFVLSEELFQEALKDDEKVDVYLIYGLRISNLFIVKLAERTKKPVSIISNCKALSRVSDVDAAARLHALGKECYSFFDYSYIMPVFEALRVRKCLASTKIFYPLKDDPLSGGCQSSFMTLEDVSQKFGVSYCHMDAMAFLDELDAMGEEEKASALKEAEALHASAVASHMPVKNTATDISFYQMVKKTMEKNGCNAFTIPCFEVCSTRELMRRGLTFCVTHSLLHDEGIPSACASDVGSIIAMEMAMLVSKKAPYMGNTMVMDMKNNVCRILHDVPSKHMKGFDQELPVELVSFTLSNWGTTMRYDFSRDVGEKVTLLSFSPDFRKMAVAAGTIEGCDNYLVPECKLACRFTVKDAETFYEHQQFCGHHYVMVYGDYRREYRMISKVFGMEYLES